jgi:2-polyprenyl-3-methyl-5-hydroxy-6-metoxy-1,4-benzoquinol methylase
MKCFCGEQAVKLGPSYQSHWGPVRLAVCKACGTYRAADTPTPEQLEALYMGGTIYTPPTDARFAELSKSFGHVVTDLKRLGYERKRVLDLGCDAGYALAAFREHGWSGVGIEVNRSTSEYARKRLGLPILSSIDELEATEKFDVIMLSHVIEHIVEPSDLLKSLGERLRPGGVLYIKAPNYGSRHVRYLKRGDWLAFIPLQHVWYFNSRSLRRLLRQNGFECLAVKTRHFFPWRSRTWGRTVIKSIVAGIDRLIPMDGEEIVGVFRKV